MVHKNESVCRSTQRSLAQQNLLRLAVDRRKTQLIHLIVAFDETVSEDELADWALSDLEKEWKHALLISAKHIG
ncbi:MAG: hypothetical protein ABF868_00615 [Sporolactobacillus sp.]